MGTNPRTVAVLSERIREEIQKGKGTENEIIDEFLNMQGIGLFDPDREAYKRAVRDKLHEKNVLSNKHSKRKGFKQHMPTGALGHGLFMEKRSTPERDDD